MSLANLRSREAVLRAVAEYDALGATAFLERYGFGEARHFFLVHVGRSYESKAIAGVAHGYEFPDAGPLRSHEFNGGLTGAAGKLRSLGFHVVDNRPERDHGKPTAPVPDPKRAQSLIRVSPPTAARAVAPNTILVGCVSGKMTSPAPAKDLYTSDLFRKRKAYANGHPCPWFILSALHGLVAPDDMLEPYNVALKTQSTASRRAWGEKVVEQLTQQLGDLAGQVIEVHAGAAYVDALREPVSRRGGVLVTPLIGLRLGAQLAWYVQSPASVVATSSDALPDLARFAIREVASSAMARPAGDFPWGRSDLKSAGVYSWWVDAAGADDLASALGADIQPGLLYAGQAGATAWPSGKPSDATLLSRIGGNHLRGRVTASTWRLSLARALLPSASGDPVGSP